MKSALKNMAFGALYGYMLVAFIVGSATIIDIAARVVPAVCK